MVLIRQTESDRLLILEDGIERVVLKSDFLEKYGVGRAIRFEPNDYSAIPSSGYLGHFNLEHTDHQAGEVYGLIEIVRHGFYNALTKEEQPPLLNAHKFRPARCIEVRQQIPYESLTPADFKYSLPHIKTVPELKETILRRYRISMPGSADDDLLARGVCFTLFELL